MPIVTVSAWEDSLDEASAATLVATITDAVATSLGEHVRAHTTVLLTGIPRSRWGTAGIPASQFAETEIPQA